MIITIKIYLNFYFEHPENIKIMYYFDKKEIIDTDKDKDKDKNENKDITDFLKTNIYLIIIICFAIILILIIIIICAFKKEKIITKDIIDKNFEMGELNLQINSSE